MMIFLVDLEVFGQMLDALAQKRNLHLGRASVPLVQFVFGNDALLRVRL
jgi:hypothetical protein